MLHAVPVNKLAEKEDKKRFKRSRGMKNDNQNKYDMIKWLEGKKWPRVEKDLSNINSF